MKEKIPVTLLTGFLGAGKTTLLNRILAEKHGRRFAVIVNEFGAIGIDGALIENVQDNLYEMSNGCICCTVQGDFNRTLYSLMQQADRFDAILIETTGLAEPGPLARTFLDDHNVAMFSELDAIVTVADAKWTIAHLSSAGETRDQIAFADLVVLNKADLVTAEECKAVEARLRGLNRHAEILQAVHCDVPLDRLFGRHAFDLDHMDEIKAPHSHDHAQGNHVHDDSIVSVSLEYDGEVDRERLLAWFSALIERDGAKLFRCKGILAFPGESQRFVLQSVHDVVDGIFQRPWALGERRQSKLVLIGRDLDVEALQSAFASYAVQEDNS